MHGTHVKQKVKLAISNNTPLPEEADSCLVSRSRRRWNLAVINLGILACNVSQSLVLPGVWDDVKNLHGECSGKYVFKPKAPK